MTPERHKYFKKNEVVYLINADQIGIITGITGIGRPGSKFFNVECGDYDYMTLESNIYKVGTL